VVSGTQGVEGKLIYISGDTSENQAWISMLVLGDLSFFSVKGVQTESSYILLFTPSSTSSAQYPSLQLNCRYSPKKCRRPQEK